MLSRKYGYNSTNRDGANWSVHEETLLKVYHKQGFSASYIAKALGRTAFAIQCRLEKIYNNSQEDSMVGRVECEGRIRVTVKETECHKDVPKYPCLMVYTSRGEEDLIVLFSSEYCGTIISGESVSGEGVSGHRCSWDITMFKPFHGTVELKGL